MSFLVDESMPEFQMRGVQRRCALKCKRTNGRTADPETQMRMELRAESNAANLTKFNDTIADIRIYLLKKTKKKI